MSTTENDAETTAPLTAPNSPEFDASKLAEQWTSMLETLVPPENVEVEDVLGNVYRLRSSLPAAVETRIIRRLRGVRLPPLDGVAGKIRDADGDVQEVLGSVVDAIADLAGDEEILRVLSDAFTTAHPKAVRLARERAEADEDFADYLPEGRKAEASDMFSLASMIAGIVPFAILAVRQIGSTATSLLRPTS